MCTFGRIAQLVRAGSLYLWGPWFESMYAHQIIQNEAVRGREQ